MTSILSLFTASAAQAKTGPELEVMLGLNTNGHNGHVTRLLIDQHRSELISVSHDKTIRFWDLATFSPIRTLRPPIGRGMVGELYAASLSPDGHWLAVCGFTAPEGTNDHSVLLISLPDGHLVRRLPGNTMPVQDVAFSPNGQWLAVGGTDGILRLWETATWNLVRVLPGHLQRIDGLAWHPDSSRLVSASWDGTVRFWTLTAGTSIPVTAHAGRLVFCVVWSPDGQTVATGGGDKWVRLWDANGNLKTNLIYAPLTLETLKFSPDGNRLVYGFGGYQTNPLGAAIIRLPDRAVTAQYFGNLDTVISSTMTPDGRYTILGDCDDQILVFEADTGRLVRRLRSEGMPIYSTGFGADGSTIAFGYIHQPGSSLKATNPLQRTFSFDRLQFGPTPDYTFMRAQANWGPFSIERKSFREALVRQNGMYQSVYYDPNMVVRSRTLLSGNRAAIGCDQNVIVFDALTGRAIYKLPGHLDAVWAVTPSPDQRHLLTGSDDETMHIWNLERYEHTLSLFVAGDDWVAWTPQGYYAASPGGENYVGWHVQYGFDQMATFYPASRFRSRFYKPEMVRRVLALGGPMAALKELNRISGTNDQLIDIQHSLPPEISLTATPVGSGSPDNDGFEIHTSIKPSDGDALRSVRLLVDGRPAAENRDTEQLSTSPVPAEAGGGSAIQIHWNARFSPGHHELVLKADSDRSSGLSEPVSISIAPETAMRPRLFVMSIGVSSSQRVDLNRPFAAADARSFAAEFAKPPSADFGDVQVRTTIDLQVSRPNLEEGFQWLQQNMTPNDVGIVYFAGYALRDTNDTLHFQPRESRFNDPAAGMPDHSLRKYLQKTSGRLLVIMDMLTRDESPPTAALPAPPNPSAQMPPGRRSLDDLIRQLASDDCGVAIIANTNPRDSSTANSSGRSQFAQTILDGIVGKADLNGDGAIDVKELLQYMRTELKQRTNGDQIAVTAYPALVPTFPISRKTSAPQ